MTTPTGKVVPLDALGDLVPDGSSVAFGGGWFANHPMAAVRQLVRTGRKDIHAITVVGSAASRARDRAIANAATIIADIEQYRQRTGVYPAALNSLWPDYPVGVIGIERYRYEPNAQGYNLYFRQPSTDIATQEIVMYNPAGEQDFSSHEADLLQLSPEQIRLQRGYFASHQLAQAGWKRFLFD